MSGLDILNEFELEDGVALGGVDDDDVDAGGHQLSQSLLVLRPRAD